MKSVIYVNERRQRSNRKNGTKDPCLAVKTYKGVAYGHEVVIVDDDGVEVARIVLRKSSGNDVVEKLWVETNLGVKTVFHIESEA